MGLLSAKIGQVTGVLGLGSGIPLLVMAAGLLELELDPHASSSEPMPPAAPSIMPPPAPSRRKPRRGGPERGGVPSAFHPPLGCMPHHPSSTPLHPLPRPP